MDASTSATSFRLTPDPLVTVVVPTYNASATIAASVESALSQDWPLEVVVIDDASTDDTVVRLQALHDRRVRIHRNAANHGPGYCRAVGFGDARGPWIALLDADDTWSPGRLRALLRDVAEDAAIIADDVNITTGQNEVLTTCLAVRRLAGLKGWVGLEEFVRYDLAILKPIVRRDVLQRVSWRRDLRLTEDFDFFFRALVNGFRWRQLPDAYYNYNVEYRRATGQPIQLPQASLISVRALLREFGDCIDPGVRAALRVRSSQALLSLVRDGISQRRIGEVMRVASQHPEALRGLAVAAWRAAALRATTRRAKGYRGEVALPRRVA